MRQLSVKGCQFDIHTFLSIKLCSCYFRFCYWMSIVPCYCTWRLFCQSHFIRQWNLIGYLDIGSNKENYAIHKKILPKKSRATTQIGFKIKVLATLSVLVFKKFLVFVEKSENLEEPIRRDLDLILFIINLHWGAQIGYFIFWTCALGDQKL